MLADEQPISPPQPSGVERPRAHVVCPCSCPDIDDCYKAISQCKLTFVNGNRTPTRVQPDPDGLLVGTGAVLAAPDIKSISHMTELCRVMADVFTGDAASAASDSKAHTRTHSHTHTDTHTL